MDALTDLLGDERGKSAEWEKRCIDAREKVAAMMMRVSIATGHGDTIDALLAELEAAIVLLQVKEENAYESGYEHGYAVAMQQSVEAEPREP